MSAQPKKRWRVDVFFTGPSVGGPHLIEQREFRFRPLAMLFAWQNDQWSGWRSTQPEIVDQHQ